MTVRSRLLPLAALVLALATALALSMPAAPPAGEFTQAGGEAHQGLVQFSGTP